MGGGGVKCFGVGMVGERSTFMGTAPFPFFCCPAPKKREMVIVSGDAKESQAEEVEFKWL